MVKFRLICSHCSLTRWTLAIRNNFFALFPDRYKMSITMIFGSMIGGATSEGGGAVAFPVMTLALAIDPAVARDFSLMCQCCGNAESSVLGGSTGSG